MKLLLQISFKTTPMKKKTLTKVWVLVAFMGAISLQAQTRYLRGKVKDAEGNPIPGTLVKAVGENLSQTTMEQGEWALATPATITKLEFTKQGYLHKVVDIPSGSDIIDVVLELDVVQIEAVTITALGIKKSQRSLGYSAQTVKGSEVAGSGEQNVVQGISSKVAGALVTGSGGTPGASAKIIIRGAATFSNENQPLFVIDGVPIDNSTTQSSSADYPFNPNLQGVNNSNRAIDVNPDDIETITVLKGPAAAALYGVRGANGAIIITTKRAGTGGKKFAVDFNTSLDFSMVNKLPEKQRIYGQGTGGGTFTIDSNGNYIFREEGTASRATPESWGARIANPVNNEDAFFGTAQTWTQNLSVLVGGDRTSARFSIGNTKQGGIVPNSKFNRTTFRVNTDTRLNDKWLVGSSINLINSGGIRPQNGSNLSGVMLGLMRAPADFDLQGGQGEKNYMNPDGTQYSYFSIYDNPNWSAYENPFQDNVNRFLGNTFVSFMPKDWITATWRVGTDQWTDARKQIFAIGSWQPDNSPGGEVNENTLRYKEWYSDILLNLRRNLGKDVEANVTLGNNLNTRESADQYLRGRDLAIPNFYNINNASNLYANSSSSKIKTAAIFLSAEFAYKSVFYLNLTARNEWASTFGAAKSSFLYPSANASIVFTEWMGKSDILSFGKLRLAYAQAGINPPAYATRTYYVNPFFTDGFTGGISFPYLGQNGFGQSNILGNAGLRPEKNTTTELGFDLRFFNGKLNLDLTLYKQKSTDILVNMPIAPSSGYQEVLLNSGEMENNGIEIILGAKVFDKKNWGWNVNLNFASNRNKVLKLAPGVDEIDIETAFASIGSYAIVGEPYGVLYGSRWERNANGDLIIQANGLPKVANTRGNVGNPYPKWYGGLRNTLNYKGLSLTFLLDVRKGGQIWNGTYARMTRLGLTEETTDRNRTYVIEGVKESDGTPNNVPISAKNYYSIYKGDAGAYAVENSVQDGGWFRLRELGLNYAIPLKSTKTISKLEIGVTGRNLILVTKYLGVDPETSLTGAGSNIGGFDYFNNPGLKSFMFNLRVGI
jgi:TonB-linked SusC/RagA family outer membrane protein